jgi:hypothetical protein
VERGGEGGKRGERGERGEKGERGERAERGERGGERGEGREEGSGERGGKERKKRTAAGTRVRICDPPDINHEKEKKGTHRYIYVCVFPKKDTLAICVGQF